MAQRYDPDRFKPRLKKDPAYSGSDATTSTKKLVTMMAPQPAGSDQISYQRSSKAKMNPDYQETYSDGQYSDDDNSNKKRTNRSKSPNASIHYKTANVSDSNSYSNTKISHDEWLVKKNKAKKLTHSHSSGELNNLKRNKEFGWKSTENLTSLPPSDYTISNINQHHDLLVS